MSQRRDLLMFAKVIYYKYLLPECLLSLLSLVQPKLLALYVLSKGML